jgi:hypothetical protein
MGYVEDFFETRTKLVPFSEIPEAAQNFRRQGRMERDDGERSLGKGASLGEEAVLADSGRAGENVGDFQQPICRTIAYLLYSQ